MRSSSRGSPGSWLILLCILLMPASVPRGQTVTSATVTGTVRDGSGAVVSGATVEIANDATNQSWHAATDQRGRFTFLYLPVGGYHLLVHLDGFATATAALTLRVGDQLDVPIVLAPARLNEAVQVQAAAPLIEARRTAAAAAIAPEEIDTLPLNGRNYLDLALARPQRLAHQPAHHATASRKHRPFPAPASRYPASEI